MTAKTRVLLLPLIVIGVAVAAFAAFFVARRCSVDGRESSGDKREWSILQSLEATHRGQPIADLEFVERGGYQLVCLPGDAVEPRLWIMLDPQNPPFYKQLPQHHYSLSREQYQRIVSTGHTTSTVADVLESHVQ